MGSAKSGFAFGLKGIYYYNDWSSSKTGHGFFPYEDLNQSTIEIDPKVPEIILAENKILRYDVEGHKGIGNTQDLLRAIQSILKPSTSPFVADIQTAQNDDIPTTVTGRRETDHASGYENPKKGDDSEPIPLRHEKSMPPSEPVPPPRPDSGPPIEPAHSAALTIQDSYDMSALIDQEMSNIVKEKIPELINYLVKMLTDGLIDNVMWRGMRQWRDREVITLNDLETHMQQLAIEWLCSKDAKQRITDSISAWFKPIQEEMDMRIQPICQRYDIPFESLAITLDYQSEYDFQGVNIEDPTAFDEIVNTVSVITIVVGTGLAFLIASGPIGWMIGLVSSLFVVSGYEKIKSLDIPGWLRKKILSDNKINNACEAKRSELEGIVREMLEKDQFISNELPQKIIQSLKASLQKKLNGARMLIR